MENSNFLSNSLSLANVNALSQGESSGWGGLDSVYYITDTRSVQYLEDWKCDLSSQQDTRQYAINVTRSCDGKGLLPCASGTGTEAVKTEERSCIHQIWVR